MEMPSFETALLVKLPSNHLLFLIEKLPDRPVN